MPAQHPLLAHLLNHRPAGLNLPAEMIVPDYSGASLANLPASICRCLGADPLGQPLHPAWEQALGGPYQQVLLFVLDGLGWDWLHRYWDQNPTGPWDDLLRGGTLLPLTSVVPSTTSTALTSLWTGVPAAVHGLTGYEMWLKEYGTIANMINHAPANARGDVGGLRRSGFVPETFLPVPTLGTHLAAHGVTVSASLPIQIANSSLSAMHQPNVRSQPVRTLSDLWVSLSAHLQTAAAPSYTYLYWSTLDELSHIYGPEDERVALEFELFGLQLRRFLNELRRSSHGETLILLSADHGQLATPKDEQYDLRRLPELLNCLTLQPTCENRLPVLHLRPGREDTFRRIVEREWPGQFTLLPSAQALQSGLFGPEAAHPALDSRLGDCIAVPHGAAYWWWANRENHLLGRHGGLSRAEMLVPLAAWVV